MSDLQKPAKPKPLPFKRTVPRRPSIGKAPEDDSGLSLFSKSKDYFSNIAEDRQRRAQEKADKERKNKTARDEQERREAQRKQADQRKQDESAGAKKRNRPPIPIDQESDDDVSATRPSKTRKPSSPHSPDRIYKSSTTRAPRHRPSSSHDQSKPPSSLPRETITLSNSSDDEDSFNRQASVPKTSFALSASKRTYTSPKSSSNDKGHAIALDDSSDSDDELVGAVEDPNNDKEDVSARYIQATLERMAKAKAARLAREASATGSRGEGGDNDEERGIPVSVMIAAPSLPDAKTLMCKVRTAQPLEIAFNTFQERVKAQTNYPHHLVSDLVFTWRGDRIYGSTKLETLGIRPRGPQGRLHDSIRGGDAPEGFHGRDNVYFEAQSPEEYEESQRKRERERKRREAGEWWEDEQAQEAEKAEAIAAAEAQDAADRVRVSFQALNMPKKSVTLRKYNTVAHMIKAFRRLAGLPEDKHVEIVWDGEVLDLETTVEEAEIGDMDMVEVHLKS
ncbi:hypothetical protein F5Y18DRAFT_391113 [Xylariaceae sp. FL1019]|nr:hypothetical protein F5Y18DRAFT_391113 [Xylariaceae sp. FL1019]